jgi:hypothetical protein
MFQTGTGFLKILRHGREMEQRRVVLLCTVRYRQIRKCVFTDHNTTLRRFWNCNVKTRQAVLIRLRISAHRLPVETGRYSNVPYDRRICQHCDLNSGRKQTAQLISFHNTEWLSV